MTGQSFGQQTIFSQDFSSSTSVASYVSGTPGSGQFDAITVAGSNTVSITGGALRFTRGNNRGSFTRSTNFSPVPTAIVYSMDLTISGTPGGNSNGAATFQVGNSYNTATNGVEPDANTFAQFQVDFRGTTNFRLRDITNNNTSSNYSVGTTYTITWVMNNSGSTLTYTSPSGSAETIANDRMDFWVGTTREFNDVNIETTSSTLADLKFSFNGGTGNIDIDDINIYSINPFITAQPSALARCVGGSATYSVTASGTSLSYQWRKGTTNLTNGGNIAGATSSSLTINPVSATDAATDYNVVITSSGGYTATSGNTALTVNAQPTITTSAAAANACFSGSAQSPGLSYSATTNSPTNYTITWNAAALSAGLVNVGSTALPASPITVPVAASVAAGTYTGTLTVTNAAGCASTGNSFTLTINPAPQGSLTGNTVCGSGTGLLTFTASAGTGPFTVVYNDGVSNRTQVGVVSGSAFNPFTNPGSTTNYTLVSVTDNNGCARTTGFSGGTGTITVSGIPTISPAAAAVSKCYSGSFQNSTLIYSATTNSPNSYTITWNAAALSAGLVNMGTTALSSSPLTVQVAAGVAAGTYTGTLTVTNAAGCVSTGNTFTLTINPLPTITAAASASTVCFSSSAQSSSLTYSATTNSPTLYNIVWNAAALAAGLVNVGNTALPASPITVPVAANVAAGTYTGTLNVINVVGCGSTGTSFTLTINPAPQGSLAGNTVCAGGTGQLTFTATVGAGPFTIVYNDGVSNRTQAAVVSGTPFSPFTNPAVTTSYTLVSVTGSNGCARTTGFTGGTGSITVNQRPTITTPAAATSKCFSAGFQNSGLTYSGTTNSPNSYTVTWDAAALSAGLVNMGSTALPASPLSVQVAAGVVAGTYNGTLTVTNAAGCSSTGNAFTLTINPLPTITTAAAAATVCSSTSAQSSSLSYSATTGSPTLYNIVWNAAALSAGLVNLGNTALPASPVTVPVAANVAGGTYTGTLNVINVIGCGSTGNNFTITVTPAPQGSFTGNTICSSGTGQLTFTATAGTGPFTVIYTDGLFTRTQTGVISGVPFNTVSTPLFTTSYPLVSVTDNNGCTRTTGFTGGTATITIGTNPANKTFSAASPSICSGTSTNITTLLGQSGVSYQLRDNTTNASIGAPASGIALITLPTGTLTTSDTFNVLATATASGCAVQMTPTIIVTVNPLPITTALPASQTICSGNSITSIALNSSNSIAGTTYTWSRTTPAGISGTVATSGTGVPAGTLISGSFTNSNASATTVTFTVNSTSPAGCAGSTATATVTVNKPVSITTQPTDQTVCSGSSVSFTVAATGTGLTYQWRKGTTNLCSCGTTSGTTTATLTINPSAITDNATDYNCVVTGASCTSVITNYVSLTVNTIAVTPNYQPRSLVFPSVGVTSILASFSPSSDAMRYLVIRTATSAAPTNPVNGTSYTAGTSALGGYIEYTGTGTSFTSNGLTPGTTYYYWIYSFNTSTCGTSPLYLTTAPETNSATTATNVACGTITTLYWGGAGSGLTGATAGTDFNTAANWSTSNSSYVASPSAPSQCNNASMNLTGTATITLSGSTDVYNLTFTISGNNRTAKLSANGNVLSVYGNAVVDVLSGSNNTSVYIGETSAGAGIIDFKANFRLGETYYANNIPASYIVGNINSKITFRGDVLLGRTASFILPGSSNNYPPSYPLAVPGTGKTPGTVEFDGVGLQQVLWNNNVYYDCFYNIVIGNQNKPYVKHVTGTYTPDNILNDLTINDGCTVDIGTSQWIREQSGGTFTMNGSAKLILGNNLSVRSSANTGVRVTGSNFPGGFATMNISSNSTIEYNGGNSMTQTVYATPTYGNLILSNIDGSGTANKISTGTVSIDGTATVSDKTTFTPGTGITVNGTMFVNSGATLVCGTNAVSGGGDFALLDGGTLTMASTAGITASGATGNIQTGGRSFGTAANYTYNGSSAQATGNGLPNNVNDLTILNAAGVTIYAGAANYTVAGTLRLTTGALTINGNTLNINALQRSSGTLTGSATSSVGVNGTGVPLFFTSGARTLKDLSINAGASADLQTPLDITAGSSAGSLAIGSGATFNTYDNLTLKSDANGTARVAAIPVDGSGNALGTISGKVQIERFITARRGWRLMNVPIQPGTSPTFNAAWQEGVVNSDYVYANNNNPNPGFGMHITGGSAALGFDQSATSNASIKSFNYTNSTWAGISNTNTAKPTDEQGYMVFVRGNRGTQISLNQYAPLSTAVLRVLGNIKTGRQTINIPASSGSYSVIGNPFASAINFKNVSTSANITSSSFLLWDPKLTGTSSVGAFQYFTQLGGPGSDYQVTPGGGSYGAALSVNNIIQSSQAFMLQRTTGSGTVTINENAKVSSSSSAVYRPANNPTVGYVSTVMSFLNPDSTTAIVDGVLTAFSDNYTDAIDYEDVRKINNINECFGIQKNNLALQIEKRQPVNTNDTIFYKMTQLYLRDYKLSLTLNNIAPNVSAAYLQDSYLQTSTALNLSGTTVYDFKVTNVPAAYDANRFRVVFRTFGVVPVTFSNIMANRQNNNIAVEWNVENETGISNYEVEKSTDGRNFVKVNTTPAAGTGNGNIHYSWLDENVRSTDNYYRIRSVSRASNTALSRVVKVSMDKPVAGIKVYPNPVTDGIINLELSNTPAGVYTTRLINELGQVLINNNIAHNGANGVQSITAPGTLPAGNYQLEVTGADNKKLTLQVRVQTK